MVLFLAFALSCSSDQPSTQAPLEESGGYVWGTPVGSDSDQEMAYTVSVDVDSETGEPIITLPDGRVTRSYDEYRDSIADRATTPRQSSRISRLRL
ncbi:MAG: hypothetical protein UY72_C0003G0003 [Candidatus Uhrbacteria bacterium GW2011_GWD2_52_7]|uniref:Uncharacterized protein n=1 Tax=Candidatus Uhrbacteria bacterium GW2011_GWD2_52_7 TaxID=1618989 RepID=A0A0G2AE93_9BACT|nr:MAG: hypothetical protein UY72_C0003G0003 [Candidatus Uhrbacteria bacterium GW2011_GWD2_52_7]